MLTLCILLFCRFTILGDAWRQCIKTVTVQTMSLDPDPVSVELSIPMSPAEHENEQLRIGRKSHSTGVLLSTCCEGQNCEAFVLRGNNRALHPYLTPSQEELFHAKGTQFEGPCLLCIRKTITSVSMMCHKDWLGVSAHNKLPMQVPFYNLVDAPGGYISHDMIMPNQVRYTMYFLFRVARKCLNV